MKRNQTEYICGNWKVIKEHQLPPKYIEIFDLK